MFGKALPLAVISTFLVFLSASSPLGAQQAGAEKKPARVILRLPDRARLLIEGRESKQKGPVRQFETPPLPPGQKFAYNLEGVWMEGGKVVVRRRQVVVEAGAKIDLDLTEQEKPSPPAKKIGSFRLEPLGEIRIEPGGVALFSVRIRRDNLTAPVAVSFTGVPATVDMQRALVAEGKNVAQVEARAVPDAVAGIYRVTVQARAGAVHEEATFPLIVEETKTAVRLVVPAAVAVSPSGKAPLQATIEGARLDRPFQISFPDLPRGVKITGLTLHVQAMVEAGGDAATGKQTIKVQARSGAARTGATLTLEVRQPPAPPVVAPKETVHKEEHPRSEKTKPPVVQHPAPPSASASLRVTLPEKLELKPGEAKLLPVRVQREGVVGPVAFAFTDIPAGISIEGTLPTSRQKTYLRATAAPSASAGEKTIRGIAICGGGQKAFTLKVQVAP